MDPTSAGKTAFRPDGAPQVPGRDVETGNPFPLECGACYLDRDMAKLGLQVLVPFLLITAVFSRITIVELTLPSAAQGAVSQEPGFRVEVIVRDQGLELTNGSSVIATMPKEDGAYDLETLSELVISLKRDHPEARVIAMTGLRGTYSRLPAAEIVGAEKTLTKPFSHDALIEAVRSILGEPPSG